MIRLARGPVVVREWREDDAEPLAVQANDARVARNLRDVFPHPYGLEDARRFLALARACLPPRLFAIEADGRVAGGIGFIPQTDVERIGAEVGYWLGPSYWGRGLATAALEALTGYAFAADPELRRLFALPFATNRASARVLEKAGYTLEGTLRQSAIKDGRVVDQWVYAILRDEWAARPSRLAPTVPRA
ncbi:MAG: GNAT family protein [Vicinamibacteria bacterium]